jgi:hypothetical protein
MNAAAWVLGAVFLLSLIGVVLAVRSIKPPPPIERPGSDDQWPGLLRDQLRADEEE